MLSINNLTGFGAGGAGGYSCTGAAATVAHTTYTSSSGTVSSSGGVSSYENWRAFDGLAGSAGGGNCWFATPATNSWIKYQFNAATTLCSYSVAAPAELVDRAPKDWTLDGSNDGTNWTTVDTQSNQTAWGTNEVRTFTLSAPATYVYYRILISANNGDGYVGIGETVLKG